ncbi:MAG: hypothetical protein HKN99_00590 [Winogradskyella sp.]|nr:hypothetical protein [Bacteroidia bacterium]NNC44362.1 hypothetical protein [Winogradskyella sp.]
MNRKKFIEYDRKMFHKLLKYRLPNQFLKIGLVVSVLSISLMFFRSFAMEGDTEWLKLVLQKTLLVGMLIMSVSKDKEEDEMTQQLRAQSYMIAFIVGVVYALVMPYVEFGVSNAVHAGGEAYKDLGDFQVLLFMLLIQLMFYHQLKWYR